MKIKIFGERNTGTNAIKRIIIKNSSSLVLPGTLAELSPIAQKMIAVLSRIGLSASKRESMIDDIFKKRDLLEQWKHAATYFHLPDNISDVHFVVLVRHPLSWLVSLFQNPYHIVVDMPQSLTDFANTRWPAVARDNLPERDYLPLELYAAKLRSYISLMNQLERNEISFSLIKFEKFVTDQEYVFDELRPFLDQPSDNFEELNASTKEKYKDSAHYADYYSKDLWRKEFPSIESIKLPPEKELFAFFGYDCKL